MRSSASDVLAGIDLAGRNVIVTGGYSGIGVETTRALAAAGARVTVPARTPDKARAALAGLANVELAALDLMDPASIDAFASDWRAQHATLHILVCNAAIMASPLARDSRGYESQFATNHLGHFQLLCRLWPALVAAKRRTRRHAVLARAPHHAGELRRSQFRAARVSQVEGVRPGEDSQQSLCSRRGRAWPRARHSRVRGAPRRRS